MYREGFKEEGKSCTGYMRTNAVSLCKWGSSYRWMVYGTDGGAADSVLGLERHFIQGTWEQVARKVCFLFWPIRVKDCIILIPDRLWSQLISCSSLSWLWWVLSFSDYFMTIWKQMNQEEASPSPLLLSLLLWAPVFSLCCDCWCCQYRVVERITI